MSENHTPQDEKHDEITFQIHKEQLEVNKKWIDTADVTIYKKKYTKEKQILVPVTCEDLIIEKRVKNPEDPRDIQIETTCIPLSEEQIEIKLALTVLNDIEINKNQYEELIQINERLKEEKIHIDTIGDVNVVIDCPSSLADT
ncbi:YsnF/AvaK domain-containing protein [Neobacillus cucumis]|uniref:YsnF/AvaK domain-containing protein n=1 Tax=Neobacillus cucumis TaxID=1740721 RepID=UPI0028532308|nr:YsnF/AvaK domain-containing protein [Neobacillus cucumis]MDR4947990.1 YsnF/AvaK domain-containing protein [Neobacillus cucumis]